MEFNERIMGWCEVKQFHVWQDQLQDCSQSRKNTSIRVEVSEDEAYTLVILFKRDQEISEGRWND